jgi:hypothetical protein
MSGNQESIPSAPNGILGTVPGGAGPVYSAAFGDIHGYREVLPGEVLPRKPVT